jgi:hypothetical protein
MLRRIAALEKATTGWDKQDEAIAVGVFYRLSLEEIDLLLLASVSDREGRSLTEPQMAAKQAYHLALRTECLGAGRRSTAGLEDLPPLDQMIDQASLRRLSFEDLKLLSNGLRAQHEGCAVSVDEAAAIQTYQYEREHLYALAGFRTTNVDQAKSSDSLSVLPARSEDDWRD